MKKFMILSLAWVSLSIPTATLCMEDDGDGDGIVWGAPELWDDSISQCSEEYGDPAYVDSDVSGDQAGGQEFGEESNPFKGFEYNADLLADMPAKPQDIESVIGRFVDDVFKQVANTNPLIEFMEKTWPGFLNNFYPEESQRRANSVEHMGEFVALLKQCPEWVNAPVKMDNRGMAEDTTLLSFAIGSAVPTLVLKAICDAGALITRENVDHANIWRSVQGKPYLAQVTNYINQRFAEQAKTKARN